MDPTRAVTSRARARKKGMAHCFFKKVKYSFAPWAWNPEVNRAQPQYTAHSTRAKT